MVLTHGFVVDGEGKKMSKSMGNVIAPNAVIDKYGAEILRLWVAASDYKDDIRISDAILKQLSDAYRRIRNTCRFILGNLHDFDPSRDRAAYAEMAELDRYMLHRLQELVKECTEAYRGFEFHTVYHRLYNYCSIDLSSFYLDILKDRLYISPPASWARRSAQTAMFALIHALARIMAPILPFTADEVWRFMPASSDEPDTVHLTDFPLPDRTLLNPELSRRWEEILKVRSEVTRALEAARAEKTIGHSLDAEVVLFAEEDWISRLSPYADELQSIFIVSGVRLAPYGERDADSRETGISGLSIRVSPAPGRKCDRCWVYDTSVGEDGSHPGICRRCRNHLEQMTQQDAAP
jgi:isoleucyl-tRNA synthetase